MLPRSLSIFFYSDEIIENLFSNIRGGVEREHERQEVPPSCSIECEQSFSLDYEELRKFFEEQKICNSQNKPLPDFRTW